MIMDGSHEVQSKSKCLYNSRYSLTGKDISIKISSKHIKHQVVLLKATIEILLNPTFIVVGDLWIRKEAKLIVQPIVPL